MKSRRDFLKLSGLGAAAAPVALSNSVTATDVTADGYAGVPKGFHMAHIKDTAEGKNVAGKIPASWDASKLTVLVVLMKDLPGGLHFELVNAGKNGAATWRKHFPVFLSAGKVGDASSWTFDNAGISAEDELTLDIVKSDRQVSASGVLNIAFNLYA